LLMRLMQMTKLIPSFQDSYAWFFKGLSFVDSFTSCLGF
jgi:hypothetical protein